MALDAWSSFGELAAHSIAVYGNPKWAIDTDVIDSGERPGDTGPGFAR